MPRSRPVRRGLSGGFEWRYRAAFAPQWEPTQEQRVPGPVASLGSHSTRSPMHGRSAAVLCAALLPAAALAGRASPPPSASPQAPFCAGEYADVVSSMSRATRAFESSADADYTYCVRTTATYEHVSYAKGGKLRRHYVRHVRHGTGFAYKAKDGEWWVATNEHVAQHPEVTDGDGEVEGVPAGSRKVRETVRIVASEADDDEGAQIPLTKVVADEALDVAVLKTRHPLKLMPYRIGRSSALRVGNMVQVRGYPLGAFAAANAGRVISTGQLDRERAWIHEDFAVDALLNAGSSGSPVFAVSCRTGELELVGVYHAGYKDAQGLNVVVAVDQLRDLLETGKAPARPAAHSEPDRGALLARVRAVAAPFVMPFGDRAVRVEAAGVEARFELLDPDFPLTSAVQVALVDRGGDLAEPAAIVLPRRFGESEIPWVSLDPAWKDPGQRLHEALWRQLAAVLAYRDAEARGRSLPDASAALSSTASRIRGRRNDQKDILQAVDFDADDVAWSGATVDVGDPHLARPPDPASNGR
jgi:serine protease Do